MKKGLALIIVMLLSVITLSTLSGCTGKEIIHIDWTDFVKWDGISYERGGDDILVPSELIGDRIGFVAKVAPSEVRTQNYKPEDGMASFLPVATEFFDIKGYDSSKYIAVNLDGEFILYKSLDSENISFEDIDNGKGKLEKTSDLKSTEYETVNNLEGVIMTVKEGTVSPNGLVLIHENNSDKECIYGEFFILEKKIDDKWYEVPVTIEGNYGFEDIGHELVPGDNKEWETDWQWLYGSLSKGEYRIIKDILDFRETGDYDTYYLAAEFTID